MRFAKIPPALIVSLLLASLLSAKESSDTGLHSFFGEVVLVDPAKKILELKKGKQLFVFHYTDQTRISSTLGQVRMDKILRGTGAVVVMRVGEGNVGIATEIRFVPSPSGVQILSLISGRTVHGETINGIAVYKLAEYRPPPDSWLGGVPLARKNNAGLFLLSVAPDGTVASVAVRQSSGYPELDGRAQRWMKRWRFRPNTVTEVQFPMFFSQYPY
ncbi:MAG: Gram-negative bacterial TonB protein C-terminal [Verrucomicrobiota bacterium]|jgi:TonB family protein